jgi:hypothetical protein
MKLGKVAGFKTMLSMFSIMYGVTNDESPLYTRQV